MSMTAELAKELDQVILVVGYDDLGILLIERKPFHPIP